LRLCEHRHILEEDLPEKSKLDQHVYEEGHTVGWNEARILEIETAGIEIQGIGPYGMLNQSYQPTQCGHFSNLDLPYRQ
jgi:hypothetical protein